MKTCPRCKTIKEDTEFYRRRDNRDLSSYCKRCTNDQTIERTRALKEKAVQYKGGCCQICGYSKCLGALDFHHKDPSEKDFTIGKKRAHSIESIKAELDKCLLVCSNCHREIHWDSSPFTI